MNSATARRRPVLLSMSVVVAGLILPILWLIDRLDGECGDGMCGFWPGLLVIASCTSAAVALAVAGCVRRERFRWLVSVMLAALLLPVGPLIGLW